MRYYLPFRPHGFIGDYIISGHWSHWRAATFTSPRATAQPHGMMSSMTMIHELSFLYDTRLLPIRLLMIIDIIYCHFTHIAIFLPTTQNYYYLLLFSVMMIIIERE